AHLRSEAQALARVRHANVVSVYDVGSYDREDLPALLGDDEDASDIPPVGVYIVMEYVDGTTLRSWYRDEERPWRQIVEVLLDAGRGLAAAHAQRVVHRDFKPDNVLVSDDGVRVVDFGLAGQPGSDGGGELATGTPGYMAPEQHAGGPTDARADQYGFCVTAFEALAGHRPFAGDDVSELVAHKRALRIIGPPPGTAVPRRIWRVLERGLAAAPEERFADMQALLAALQGLSRQRLVRRAAVAGAALAIGIGTTALLNARPSPCETRAAAIDEVWSPAVAEALRPVAEPLTGAEDWAYITADFTARAASWRTQRLALCETTEGDPTPTDPRLGCLAVQLQEFRALVEVLREGSTNVNRRARELAISLGDPDRCRHPSEARPAPLPTPGAQRVQALAVRDRLQRARLLRTAGESATYLEQTNTGVDEAQSADPITQALALEERANARWDLSHLDGAEADAREAWRLAEEAGEPTIAIDAMSTLAGILGQGRSDPAAALQLLDVVEARVSRFNAEGPRAVAAARRRAIFLRHRGDLELALTSAMKAVRWSEALRGSDAPTMVGPLQVLGSVQQSLGDNDAALATNERVLRITSAHFGDRTPRTGLALNNLATTLRTRGDLDEAQAMFAEALVIFEAAYGAKHRHVAMVLNNLGTGEHARGKDAEALSLLQRSLTIKVDLMGDQHLDVGFAHDNIANVLRGQGDAAGTRQARAKALAIWSRQTAATHPLQRGALLSAALDDAVFEPGEPSMAHLESLLLPVLSDDAIDDDTRAEGAFVLGRWLASTKPERSQRLIRHAEQMATPRLQREIDAWRGGSTP
ncbi:MAG: serine/threonine-protein kinase, partial [Myxococcota bacterium]